MFSDIIEEKKKFYNVTWTEELDEELEFAWGKWGDNPFADARYTMFEYFNIDEELYHSYQSNIAMFLNDRCNIQNKEKRDQLAKELMELLWG